MSPPGNTSSTQSRPRKSARLGRGLSSLLAKPVSVASRPGAGDSASAARSPGAAGATAAGHALVQLPIEAITPNPHQPRRRFDESALDRLAQSLRHDGMMQPVIVRPISAAGATFGGAATSGGGDGSAGQYELVAGERRWRAAQMAGLAHVPAIIRTLDDRQLAEWALIENLQREDLNPIEQAQGFRHLIEQFKLSHEQIAEQVGVDRSTITNALRLLTLDESVQQMIGDGLLSAGQGKAIAGFSEPTGQRALAVRAVKQDLSVRQVEAAVRDASTGPGTRGQSKRKGGKTHHLADLEEQLAQKLQTRVRIRQGRKKGTGTLTIEFYSLDEFDALMQRLGVNVD